MSPRNTPTRQNHSLWSQCLARAVLIGLFVVPLLTGRICAAEEPADPYEVLYDVIMTRYGPDGKSYAQNETSPAIFAWSEFPFDDKTFKKLDAALDEFAALPQERIEQYSDVKRALLQRHLWQVFDTTFDWTWWKEKPGWGWGGRRYFPKTHMDRRRASQPKLVSLIRRLALTKEQILALPQTLAATVKSGDFGTAHDPQDRFKPFLPSDLYGKDSSFICVGEDRHAIPAAQHTGKLYARSMFLQFMRLPGGRAETLEYMARIKQKTEQFPVGTQFALIEQPFLISKAGEMILSPMIVSIQLRAYLDVDRRAREARPEATQCVVEFVMQPRELMKGNAVMRALTPQDFRYEAGSEFAAGFSPYDPFATGDITEGMPTTTRLKSCMGCHGGKPGVRTRSFRGTRFFFKESGPDEISKATVAQKQEYETWKRLRELWQADAAGEGIGRATKKRVAVAELAKSTDSGSLRPVLATSATANKNDAVDPYDVLYDVIMTRWHGGKSYAEDESSPAIFTDSEFPFGDKTYNKFSAALDAFDALPQTKIEAYSDVKRALLQRHLWKLFDVTSPHQWKEWRTGKQHVASRNHQRRRTALQPRIASLIQRLALTRERILILPNTLSATVKSGGFAKRHDPTDPFKPFLPADLDAMKTSWVCMGTDETIPVDLHVERVKWRSAFYSFIRLPNGHAETLAYYDNAASQGKFPVGTQVALIEQAFLISDQGEMVLSPLTVSISLRAYVNVNLSARKAAPAVAQCVAEFVMQPRRLMQGKAVMQAVGRNDQRFEVHEKFICQDTRDPFESGRIPRRARLNRCINCHNGAGHRSVLTSGGAGRGPLAATSPAAISKATFSEKRKHHTWKTLHKLWQARGW